MRGTEIFKAALILAGAYISSYITGGRIPYFIFYLTAGILIAELIWAQFGAWTTASTWLETHSVQVGAKAKVFTEVKNNSRWPLPWVQCWVNMPETFGLSDNMCCYTFSLGPYETKVVTEEIKCTRRGKFRWGECFVRTGGLLGFFINVRRGGDNREIEVIPRFFKIGGFGIATSRGNGKLTGWPRRARENTGLFSVRNYTPADGVSKIHWKISARSGQLMVKENQQVNPNYNLILDNCTENHIGDGPDSSFEKAVSLAASAAVSASRTGKAINLTVYRPNPSSAPNTSVNKGRAATSLAAAIKLLTKVELRDSSAGEVNSIELLKIDGSGLILITGCLDHKMVQTLIRNHVCRDGIVFLLELETFGKAAVNVVERQSAVSRLRGVGMRVITINKDMDLRLVMGRSLYGVI